MAIIFQDTFTVGADTALQNHTPDIGTSWTRFANGGTILDIQATAATDRAQATGDEQAGVSNGLLYTASPGPSVAEYDVTVTLPTVLDPTGDDSAGFGGRFIDSDNFYGIRIGAGATDVLRIYKRVAGVETNLATRNDIKPVSGDTFKFEIRDATKKLFRNGVEILSTTDNEITGAGQAFISLGWFANGADINQIWEFDDFTVDEAAAGGNEGAAMYHHLRNLGVYS